MPPTKKKEILMALDLYGKTILTIIAACLVILVSAALTAKVHAANSVHCTGKLKANIYGGTAAPGGYDVDVTCN